MKVHVPAVVFAQRPEFDTPPSIVVDFTPVVAAAGFRCVQELMLANWEQHVERLLGPTVHLVPLVQEWACRIPGEPDPTDLWVQVDGLALLEWASHHQWDRLLADVFAKFAMVGKPGHKYDLTRPGNRERYLCLRDEVLHLRNAAGGIRRDAVTDLVLDGMVWGFREGSEPARRGGRATALSVWREAIRLLPWRVGDSAQGARMSMSRAQLYDDANVGAQEARRLEFGPPEHRPEDETLRSLAGLCTPHAKR